MEEKPAHWAVNVGGPRDGLVWRLSDEFVGDPYHARVWPVYPLPVMPFVEAPEDGEPPLMRATDRYEPLQASDGKPSIDDEGRYRYRYVGRR